MQTRRAEVLHDAARIEPLLQLACPATPEERRPPAGRRLRVEEHRQREVIAEPPCELESAHPRTLQVLRHDRHDRHDVGGPDPRMRAFVPAQVDSLARDPHRLDKRGDKLVLGADEREHRAVVIDIAVNVQQPRVPFDRLTDRSDRRVVAPLGEVRHRFERAHPNTLGTMKKYYDARAPEYDDVWLGRGQFAHRGESNWFEEVTLLLGAIASLPSATTLDVACGTGFLTRHLHGDVTGLDQSGQMLDEARRKAPRASFVQGDALDLPFPDGSFDRVFTSFFYGHLEGEQGERFIAECRRVARELVFVDASRERADVDAEHQQRVLDDGSTWSVFKRYFRAEELADELGGGDVLHAGRWFVMVRA